MCTQKMSLSFHLNSRLRWMTKEHNNYSRRQDSSEKPLPAKRSRWLYNNIELYTPINYFGRYATCSHKDGGRSIFSLGKPLARRTTWYAYNYVGARKFKSCVFEPLTRRVFSINTSSSSTFFLFDQISLQQQHHASQTFIYKDYETLSRLWETTCF